MADEKKETGFEVPLHERKPIGDRILGDCDPRGMSREEFETNPNLVFHGSQKPFDFHSEFDYRAEDHIRENDGSTTIGVGFYTTNMIAEAENYSHRRQNEKTEKLHISSLLPFQARVLDLRWKDDKARNAAVPMDLVNAWHTFYSDYIKNKKPREGRLGQIFDSSEMKYADYLDRAVKLKAIDLRVLLETAPSKELESRFIPSPYWTLLFSDFMLTQGYDGLTYNEGGEGWEAKGSNTVFFNLKKIGTYKSWQEESQKE